MRYSLKMLVSNSIVLGVGMGSGLGAVGCMEQATTNPGASTASGTAVDRSDSSIVEISLRDDKHSDRNWPVVKATAEASIIGSGKLLACDRSDAQNSLVTGSVISCYTVNDESGPLGDKVALVGIKEDEQYISFSLLDSDTNETGESNPAFTLAATQSEIEACIRFGGGVRCVQPGYRPNEAHSSRSETTTRQYYSNAVSRDRYYSPRYDV